jgi:hypothetical protein
MKQIDMSAQAVTARLKLVSELRRFCLLLGARKAKQSSETTSAAKSDGQQMPNSSGRRSK